MNLINAILYPGGDLDHEWTANELEWIAEVVNTWKGARA